MSESSEDRTKRIFCQRLRNHEWNYQYTVFFQRPSDFNEAHELADKVRKKLRRAYSDQAFLWRLTLKRQPKAHFDELAEQEGSITAPNLILFTKDKLIKPNFDEVVLKAANTLVKTSYRKFSPDRRARYADTVARERPHNLKAVFWKDKTKRFGILNEKMLSS